MVLGPKRWRLPGPTGWTGTASRAVRTGARSWAAPPAACPRPARVSVPRPYGALMPRWSAASPTCPQCGAFMVMVLDDDPQPDRGAHWLCERDGPGQRHRPQLLGEQVADRRRRWSARGRPGGPTGLVGVACGFITSDQGYLRSFVSVMSWEECWHGYRGNGFQRCCL
jgi:hypothetical protein